MSDNKKTKASQTEVPNDHKVPSVQWNAWTPRQRKLFNAVFKRIAKHPEAVYPSSLDSLTKTQHAYVARAVATIAASVAKDD